jgi:hypothetical protein
MMQGSSQPERGAAESDWRTARRLYAVYSGVMARFDVGVPPCPELESPIDRTEQGIRGRVHNWLALMDNRCPVTFLRQVLQRDRVGTEANLRALIHRHLDRMHKTEFDRDKLDFLLVQYFAYHIPDDLNPGDLTLAEVAAVLEPVLGSCRLESTHWLKALDELTADVAKCHCMQDLVDYRIIDRGRELKAAAGERFFEPTALVAFARYNILLRRAFFYSLRADLEVVHRNVARLEKLGVRSIDATRAGLSDHEALTSVRRICREWRNLLRTDYSGRHIFRSIKELRACTDRAVTAFLWKQKELKTREDLRKAKELAEREHVADAARLGIQLEVDLAESNAEEEAREAALLEEEPIPETTVERAYPQLIVDSDPILGTPARYRIPEVLSRIRSQVTKASVNIDPVPVRLTKSSIRLASWEAKAFLVEEDERVYAVKASVAGRLILQEAFDDFQDGASGDLAVALTIAHCEAGRMQEQIAQARDDGDVDSIIYLAATGQRLIELIREAEFAWTEEED